jgi:hypothetical protein
MRHTEKSLIKRGGTHYYDSMAISLKHDKATI